MDPFLYSLHFHAGVEDVVTFGATIRADMEYFWRTY